MHAAQPARQPASQPTQPPTRPSKIQINTDFLLQSLHTICMEIVRFFCLHFPMRAIQQRKKKQHKNKI